MLYVKHCNPLKLHLRAMKPTLESSFHMKLKKKESGPVIGMVGVIAPLSSTHSVSVTLGSVSKNH